MQETDLQLHGVALLLAGAWRPSAVQEAGLLDPEADGLSGLDVALAQIVGRHLPTAAAGAAFHDSLVKVGEGLAEAQQAFFYTFAKPQASALE